jgi:hypothetical protein
MYPKIFTHRNDHKSQVVIANAEQEAQLPDEYLPVVAVAGQAVSNADHAANAMLSPEYDALMEAREQLEQDRTDLANARAHLEKDRAELTAGYKASVAKLDEERAAFEALRHAAPVDIEAPAAAAPAKRTRAAKE